MRHMREPSQKRCYLTTEAVQRITGGGRGSPVLVHAQEEERFVSIKAERPQPSITWQCHAGPDSPHLGQLTPLQGWPPPHRMTPLGLPRGPLRWHELTPEGRPDFVALGLKRMTPTDSRPPRTVWTKVKPVCVTGRVPVIMTAKGAVTVNSLKNRVLPLRVGIAEPPCSKRLSLQTSPRTLPGTRTLSQRKGRAGQGEGGYPIQNRQLSLWCPQSNGQLHTEQLGRVYTGAGGGGPPQQRLQVHDSIGPAVATTRPKNDIRIWFCGVNKCVLCHKRNPDITKRTSHITSGFEATGVLHFALTSEYK